MGSRGRWLLGACMMAGALALPVQASAECVDNPPNVEGCYDIDPGGSIQLNGWFISTPAGSVALYHEHADVTNPTFPFVHGDHDVYTETAYVFHSFEVSPGPYQYALLITNETCHEVYVDAGGTYYVDEC